MHHRQAGATLLRGAQAQGAAFSCQRPHLTMLTDINEVISFTRELVQIRSVNDTQSNGEANVAARVIEEATRLGLHAEIIAADPRKPNVLVTVGTIDGPLVLLFVAHSDTVELGDASRWSHGPLSGYIDNAADRLYGRGACDNKGGIAVALATLARLKKWLPDEFDGKLQLAVVADEESGACSELGLRHLLNTGAIKASDRCRGSIYAYPGWTVTIGHRGVVRLVIEVKGSPLHTGSRDWAMKRKGCSAVTAMCEMVWRLETEPWPTETSEGFPELPLTITPGTLLQGGAFESIVPESASCLVDIRIPPDLKGGADAIVGRVETIVEEVMNRRNSLAGSDPSCLLSASIRRKVDIPPYQIPSTHPLAVACRDAVTQITGTEGHTLYKDYKDGVELLPEKEAAAKRVGEGFSKAAKIANNGGAAFKDYLTALDAGVDSAVITGKKRKADEAKVTSTKKRNSSNVGKHNTATSSGEHVSDKRVRIKLQVKGEVIKLGRDTFSVNKPVDVVIKLHNVLSYVNCTSELRDAIMGKVQGDFISKFNGGKDVKKLSQIRLKRLHDQHGVTLTPVEFC